MMSSCNDAPSFRITVGPDIGVDEAMWNNTVWSCADWAGYECAIGGWGLSTSSGETLRRACSASCLDGGCQSHRPATKVYVFGLESSGTRYVSRGIAQQINPVTTWDGQSPPCWSWRGNRVIHVSLPHGMYCSSEDLEHPMSIVDNADVMCQPWVRPVPNTSRVRWIANITSTLMAAPEARAVIVTRPMIFQRVSKLSNHGCGGGKRQNTSSGVVQSSPVRHGGAPSQPSETEEDAKRNAAHERWRRQLAWRREDAISRRSIEHAMRSDAVSSRVLAVPYDEMGWLGDYHWFRIRRHIGVLTRVDGALASAPRFASGDGRWLRRRHLPDLIRAAAVEARSEWDDSAMRAALELQEPDATAATTASGGHPEIAAGASMEGRRFSSDLAAYLRAEDDAHAEAEQLEKDSTRDAEIERLRDHLGVLTAALDHSQTFGLQLLALLALLASVVVWLCVLPAHPVPRARKALLRRARTVVLEPSPISPGGTLVPLVAQSHGLVPRRTGYGVWVGAHRSEGTCDWTCGELLRFVEASEVVREGMFERAGGQEGDVLLRIAQRWVSQPADVLAALEEEIARVRRQLQSQAHTRRHGKNDEEEEEAAHGGNAACDARILLEVVRGQDAREALGEVSDEAVPRWTDLWRSMRYEVLPHVLPRLRTIRSCNHHHRSAVGRRNSHWFWRRWCPCAVCCTAEVQPGDVKAL